MIDLANLPVPHDDGHFVSAKISRIVELIRDKYPMLDVKWIPPEVRTPGDAAFAIVERSTDGREYIVFHVQTEEDFDHRVLARLYDADNARAGRNVLDTIESENRALRDIQYKMAQEQMDEAHDVATSILRSGRARYRHGGRVYE